MLVGHLPFMSRLASLLLTEAPEAGVVRTDGQRGGLGCLRAEQLGTDQAVRTGFSLTPGPLRGPPAAFASWGRPGSVCWRGGTSWVRTGKLSDRDGNTPHGPSLAKDQTRRPVKSDTHRENARAARLRSYSVPRGVGNRL
jgi:hypothetical protein